MEDIELRKLYRICRKNHFLVQGKTDNIVKLFLDRGATTCKAEVYKHQCFGSTFHGYKITINGKIVFFPLVPATEINGQDTSLTDLRNTLESVELPIPPYIPRGSLKDLSKSIQESGDAKKYKILEKWFYEVYSINFVAALYTEQYLQMDFISPFKIQLLEVIEAFYIGLYNLAIMSFLPIIEGVLREVGKLIDTDIDTVFTKNGLLDIIEKCEKHVINNIEYHEFDWIPSDYKSVVFLDNFNEQIQIMESLKHYINSKLYKYSSDFDGNTSLNRPGIIHGFVTDFSSPCNFFRLITILNILSCIGSLVGGKGSLWAPGQSKKSNKFITHLQAGWHYGEMRRRNLSSIGIR